MFNDYLSISFSWRFALAVTLTGLIWAGTDSQAQQPEADLLITGGKVVTMDRAKPEAQAVAIRNGRILAVGSDRAMQKFVTERTQQLQLDGQFVMPGLIEGHGHFMGLGESLMMLRLQDAETWDEIVAEVAAAAESAIPGQWIVGRGWHQSKWKQAPEPNVDGYPTVASLSARTPNNPVLLTHASGHMSVANDYAMKMAGISDQTADPDGGEIVRDDSQQPIGVFREKAAGLITSVYQRDQLKRTAAEKIEYFRQAIELASKECLRYGITSFQDAGSSFDTVDLLTEAADQGQLGVRLWVMIRDSNDRLQQFLPRYKKIGYANDFLTVRAVKRSIDGALGPHGAWLLAPYSDLPNSAGLNTATVESVRRTAELALANDYQVCVHAIGDRANREVLDIYQSLFEKHPTKLPRRWRIEHAQHLHPDDIPRFSQLGVIAAMQAVHCTSDAIFVPKRLGMRRSATGAYVWRSLIDSGAVVTNGTDAPVESVDPFASLFASVTRRLDDDVTFFPEQCMTRLEALESYTIDCAYSAFEESLKGSLVPGKLADLVVLSKDLLECPAEEILDTKVLYTMVAGKVVYTANP